MNWLNFGWYGLTWYQWLGNAFFLIAIIAVILGVIGVLRFQSYTMRVLSSAKVDTVAVIAVLFGVAIYNGLSWVSAKAMLLVVLVTLTSPIAGSQVLARGREDGED